MNKTILNIFVIYIGLTCIFLLLANSVDATQILTTEEPDQIETDQRVKTNLDEIFGPDLNFPFRPESHRDNSSPVSRINPIIDQN